MVQSMDLNKMGLMPMSELEMMEIDGGRFPWREVIGGLVGGTVGFLLGGPLGAVVGAAVGVAAAN